MKKTILLLTFSLLLFSQSFNAQTLDIKWTDPIVPDKVDGEFAGYASSDYSPQYVYTVFSTDKPSVAKVAAYDKNTLKRVSICDRVNWDGKEMKYFSNSNWLLLEKNFYFFYNKEYKGVKELYVQIFDVNLKPVSPLTKIEGFTRKTEEGDKSELFIWGNKNFGEKIIIGKDISTENSINVTLEYKIFDSKFSLVSTKQVALPFIVDRKKYSVQSFYKFGIDGNIHVESKIKLDYKYDLKKEESRTNIIYSVINLNTGNAKSFPIKSVAGKDLYLFRYIENEKSIKLFGFFFDPTKGNDRIDIHGIYYASIDSKTLEMEKNFTFSYFTKEQANELFSKDSSIKEFSKLSIKNRKYSQEEQLSGEYAIEDVQFINNESIVLFCSIKHNYVIPGNTIQGDDKFNGTRSHDKDRPEERRCVKRGVGAIKINMNGQIEWTTSLRRFIDYGGSSVRDLMVINKDEKFYVVYGSDPDDWEKGKKKENKSTQKNNGKDKNDDVLEYAVFDYHTGKNEKKKYIINKAGTEKDFKKNFSIGNIRVINNELYTNTQYANYVGEYAHDDGYTIYLGKFEVVK